MAEGGFIWLASYPKSGNTWLRCLLEAYRTNGYVDINDIRATIGDSGNILTEAVSPIPAKDLTEPELYLLRPAALLQALVYQKTPRFIKTHFCNKHPVGCAPFIPAVWTYKAIYIMRDPRSVAVSFSRHFNFSQEKTVAAMNNDQLGIGGELSEDTQTRSYVGGWSGHVNSWFKETKFPVLMIRYETLLERTEEVLKDIIEFCDLDYDEARAKRAVRAASLKKLQKLEQDNGFRERPHRNKDEMFFTEGGTRWQQELGSKWIAQLEKDHGEVMEEWGYL
jgi:hypothetical protein